MRLFHSWLPLLAALSLAGGCPQPDPSPPSDGVDPDGLTDGADGAGDVGGPGPETPTGDNHPPKLERIGDRIVGVGEQLVIVVEASDPDGDELTFSVFGSLPDGAKFDKAQRQFEWTPTAAGNIVFLTFVVSDGAEFDRETIRVEVVADATAHPPEFQPVGDQIVVADEAFSLQLEATDPDGGSVAYGFEGSVPGKPQLDETTGLFEWTPSTKLIGETVRITFTATDGGLTASVEVDFIVTDGSGGGATPLPPAFEPVAPQTGVVGEALSITLVATDPNPADTLEYGVFAGQPSGATLTGAEFTWTPGAGDANTAWQVVFSVTDGTFTSFTTVEITVASETTASCGDDPGEPNESIAAATPLSPGTIDRTMCDSEVTGLDDDFYSLDLAAGEKVVAVLTFEASAGDLELFFVNGSEQILASSQTLAGEEAISWTAGPGQEGTFYIVVLGVGQPSFAMPYTLTVAIETDAESCVDDDQEPNDDIGAAKPLPSGTPTLQICAGDKDYFAVELTCGQDVTVTLDTMGTGDLDFGLYPPGSTTPIATGATEAPVEVGTAESVETSGAYHVAVVGYPSATEEGSYTLTVDAQGGCPEDAAGAAEATAMALSGTSGSIDSFALCCADDWFSIGVAEGEHLVIDVSVASGTGSAGVTLKDAQGVQLANASPAPGGGIVQLQNPSAGTVYVVIAGTTNTIYSVSWLIEPPSAGGCTAMTCQKYNVCDAATGECVSDFCIDDSDCPGGHICLETYCANPCTSDTECRTEYACKAFAEGMHCGISGGKSPGETCFSHTSCDGNAVCWFQTNGGYCSAVGCLENPDVVCPEGTTCTLDSADTFLCGLSCAADQDCRVEDGFTCTPPEDTCLPP